MKVRIKSLPKEDKNARKWKKQYGGPMLNNFPTPAIQNNMGMLPNGQIGQNPNIPNYSKGFFPKNNLYPDLNNENYVTTEYKSQFGIPNRQAILGFGLGFGALQAFANTVDQNRNEDYINQEQGNQLYSNLTPISGQSQGVKYGYNKYGGFLRKKQYGGSQEDDFDAASFLWDDDNDKKKEDSGQNMISEEDLQNALNNQRKQLIRKQNQELSMNIVNQGITNSENPRNPTYNSGDVQSLPTQTLTPGISEMFYDPISLNYNAKRGYKNTPFGGHDTHGHFASHDINIIQDATQLAKSLGLNVREDGEEDKNVEHVHAKNSNHYQVLKGNKRAAMDINGDPKKLTEFFKIIQSKYKI